MFFASVLRQFCVSFASVLNDENLIVRIPLRQMRQVLKEIFYFLEKTKNFEKESLSKKPGAIDAIDIC